MKKFFTVVAVTCMMLIPAMGFAQTTPDNGQIITIQLDADGEFQNIRVNDQENGQVTVRVGDGVIAAALTLGASVLWLVALAILLGIAGLVLWLVMFIHVATAKMNTTKRVVWIVLLLVFGILASLVYYFAVKRPMDKK